ncbi:MAG: homocysteine S-methyltransferase family protein [Planctomycetota bacterium]|jgi:5-methyltetrahydrofolate--homocysteine methyltransferase
MSRPDILQALKQRPLLCDGAMGTQLMEAGLTAGACGELWNVAQPRTIEQIHGRYVDAGCDLVTTNSFGGTRTVLKNHNAADQAQTLNRAAAQIARQAAGDDAWVLGDLGPFGEFLEPLGATTADQLLDIFTQQVDALIEGGAHAILVETMSDPVELTVAVRAARQSGDLPVFATCAFQLSSAAGLRTMMGTTVHDAVRAAIDAGTDAVGSNCGTDLSLDDYRRLADEMLAAADSTPVILQPNAGAPQRQGADVVYPATPQDMAQLAADLVDKGVRIVGGCCGTTPAHLAEMAHAVKPNGATDG